jgi:acetyl-CoA carboxylase biotin carboxyl carrier protein
MKNSNENLLESSLKKQVSALYDIMQSEKLEELEIEESDFHIHLKRKGKYVTPAAAAPALAPAAPAAVVEAVAEQTPAVSGETVQSPIMGVFYRAPSPSSPTFVKEGDVVDAGKTLCIVEAMKVMNEIKAAYRMKIVKILVENGKSIDASQSLFQVEKA